MADISKTPEASVNKNVPAVEPEPTPVNKDVAKASPVVPSPAVAPAAPVLAEKKDEKQQSAEVTRILAKYPDRIPILVERAKDANVPEIDKKKFLAPHDLTVGQFVYTIRKRIKLRQEQAIFLFVNKTLPPSSALLSQMYKENKNKDGFLVFEYSGESTFG